MVRALEPALMENFKASGIEVNELTDAERARFKKATASVGINVEQGNAGRKIIEAIRKAQ